MDKLITLELTVLEVMALRAMIAESTTDEDVRLVRNEYGDEAADLVRENDVGFEVFVKLGEELEAEGF